MYRKSSLRTRSLLTGVLLLLIGAQSMAQNETLDSINLQLRQLFSPLSRPVSPKWFLYDMAAHVTDSVFYQTNCPDANETAVWYKVYEEMYHAAYDTAPLLHPTELFTRAGGFYADTIPIGILNYSFYRLRADAMTTNNYFNFDTVNTVLTDKAGRLSSPYEEGSIFIAAPLLEAARVSNPVFRIDPAFIFFDSFNAANFNSSGLELRIDFGDGNGWVIINPAVVTHRQVRYGRGGPQSIRVGIFNRENAPVYGSQARFVTGTAINVPPDETITLPGLTAALYRHCNDRGGTTGRTVIYLSGFDPFDFIPAANRTAGDIYNQVLRDDRLIQLRNQGYNFLVVDWTNSRIDMRFNALYFVNLLEQLKCTLGDREQFVVMGESIGAVIARYALTYMESEAYDRHDTRAFFVDQTDINNVPYLATHPDIFRLPARWCMPERRHNTRLFLSLDGPHQGANIPISVQLAYRHVMDLVSRHISLDLQRYAQAFNFLLDGQAAQQVLIYHLDTESGAGFIKSYTSRDDYVRFFGQLLEMGSYPRLCKVVLMSNGALDGERQTNFYTNSPRTPGDRLLDFNVETFARVLGFRIPIFGARLFARTNPDGADQVMEASAGRYSVRIRLRWFGVRINVGYNSLLLVQDFADTRPYCTSAGGWVGFPTPISPAVNVSSFNLSETWILNLFHYTTGTTGNGCWVFDTHIGLNGFLSANINLSLCTDGMHFCLVPVQSALDYGRLASQPLDLDIQRTDINTKLSLLPANADVMIGYTGTGTGIETNNTHVGFRNDAIPNLNGGTSIYFSCIGVGNNDVRRGMLNLEIGDEELYLDNSALQWVATYQTEYDLYVNFHNPQYEYPGTGGLLDGAYSKDADFTVEGAGFATFLHDRGGSPTGVGFVSQNLDPAFFNDNEQILLNCCVNFVGARRAVIPVPVPASDKKTPESFIRLSPNPNNGSEALLSYKFKKPGRIQVDITNMTGQRVLSRKLAITDATHETKTAIDLSRLHLSPGLYLVRLNNGSQTLTSRLLIAK